MFKTTLLISSFFFLSSAFAAKPVYKLAVNLKMNVANSERVTDQTAIVASDSKVELVQEKYSYLEITPSSLADEPGKVHLKMALGLLVKGQRQLISTPEMIVTEGKLATMTVGEDDGPDSFTLSILANRHEGKSK